MQSAQKERYSETRHVHSALPVLPSYSRRQTDIHPGHPRRPGQEPPSEA